MKIFTDTKPKVYPTWKLDYPKSGERKRIWVVEIDDNEFTVETK